jgi:hypothetical protein
MNSQNIKIFLLVGLIFIIGILAVFGVILLNNSEDFSFGKPETSETPLLNVENEITETLAPSPTLDSTIEEEVSGEALTITPESDFQIELPPITQEVIESMPIELAEKLARIEDQVSRIRGLTQTGDIQKTLISESDLGEIVVNDFFSEYSQEESSEDVLVLSLLGLLPDEFNLLKLYQELYTEQIAGFYDNETKEIYVVQGEKFGGSEKLTYAHEFTHMLQDYVYNFEEGLNYNDEACEADSERCAAILSLLEGDATLTEILWFQKYASRIDYQQVMRSFDELDTSVIDSAPAYIAADLYFPYEYGLTFVQSLYDEGGFAAVDNAYREVPVSTEQILHPERYPEDVPVVVSLPERMIEDGGSWSLLEQNVMGEWYIYLILNKGYDASFQISEDIAWTAAEGWGGDSYAFYINEETDELAFVLDAVWDSRSDAIEFADAFRSYANLRWGEPQGTVLGVDVWQSDRGVIVFEHQGDRTLWVIGPNEAILESMLLELR